MDTGIFNDEIKALQESEYSLSSELDLTSVPPTELRCVWVAPFYLLMTRGNGRYRWKVVHVN